MTARPTIATHVSLSPPDGKALPSVFLHEYDDQPPIANVMLSEVASINLGSCSDPEAWLRGTAERLTALADLVANYKPAAETVEVQR